MDIDEYEYWEKTVEEQQKDRDSSKKKKSDSADKTERSYWKRDVNDDLDGEDGRSKRSRGDDENGSKKDHYRDRDRERERSSGRHREKEKDGERSGRSFRDKKDNVEPEADPERDQRTVFAYQMPLKATEMYMSSSQKLARDNVDKDHDDLLKNGEDDNKVVRLAIRLVL